MKVLIAGGGIGGLTAALSLHQAGISVRVFESTPRILPLGVGINLLPNASRELCELGLQPELDRLAIRTRAMCYFTRRGRLVIDSACGEHAGYRWPQYSIHRGEFQLMLARALVERAGPDSLVTGHRLADFEQSDSGVTARFVDAGTEESVGSETGDILIAADGLHSTVRERLLPGEGKPLYTGMMTYRGAAVGAPYLDGDAMVIIGDVRQRLVSYPISAALRAKGQSHINWIAVFPRETADADETWDDLTDPAELMSRYRSWQFDWFDIPSIIRRTERIMAFPVYDRDPLSQWTFGRATLLGDAAHPLIPVSSSGAVQAIIDGRALAYALARANDPVAGLKAYEEDRLPKANAVVRASRENGPDEVLELARERVPETAENVYDYVPRDELQAVLDDFKEKAGFGVDRLNNLPGYNTWTRSGF
jgi:2-polyprenyl-6-methoxyphenol hydroxylase-like FAD-dependent oxidoreductase